MRRLEGKTAIVTGAAQGLGEAIASRLAKEGCVGVTLADLQTEKAHGVAQGIEAECSWCKTLVTKCDVTSEADVAEMVQRHVRAFGKLDIMVANAGILIAHDITEFPADQWKKVVDVNLYGYFLCAREAAKVMVQQKSGVIIQINSKSGKKGSFRNSAYAASKFGGIGLTQSIALDLAPYGVRVNAICPGNLLDSPLWRDSLYEQYARKWGLTVEQVRRKYEDQVPLGRGCTYDDVTSLLVFLVSDEASYITGEAYSVTGGQL
ncbi:MAG: sorbitol-6-phosphate dehydrogenase [Armatimonadota bacterium]|nr:sorbitol-6-phosphate dehydrogenase [bacterium]MDW8320297.1 sorbitol-6-phosphate dehydrogenase [Armatimonadota bacterium]